MSKKINLIKILKPKKEYAVVYFLIYISTSVGKLMNALTYPQREK